MTAFDAALADFASLIEADLETRLDSRARAGEIVRPERLMAAMRHAVYKKNVARFLA